MKNRVNKEGVDEDNLPMTQVIWTEKGVKGTSEFKQIITLHINISPYHYCSDFIISPLKLLYHFTIEVV